MLVSAPAQFGGLQALAEEAVDGPGVDEFADCLGPVGDLGIAFGDMDYLDSEPGGLRGPLRT